MIHRYQKKGLNFVLDVNSGAVHLLDDISYAVSGLIDENMTEKCPESVVEALPQYAADDVREAYGELYELKKAGQLFAEDDYIDVSRYIPVGAPVKALCLHVAHDCNLRCKYCFASTGDFGQGRKIMPPEVAKKAIDFVIARSGKRHNIEVDFFGGEPLMAWDTVTQTVDYARSIEEQHGKKFRFTITTNGLLLDEDKRRYINENIPVRRRIAACRQRKCHAGCQHACQSSFPHFSHFSYLFLCFCPVISSTLLLCCLFRPPYALPSSRRRRFYFQAF